MADFARDIRRWADITGKTVNQAVRSVQVQALTKVIEATPVDTGQARGGWHTSVGEPSTQVGGIKDKPGTATRARGLSDTRAVGSIFYVVNNLPYISVLEFGNYGTGPGATQKTTRDGYSVQAPEGMVRISVIEIKAAIRRTIRDAQR